MRAPLALHCGSQGLWLMVAELKSSLREQPRLQATQPEEGNFVFNSLLSVFCLILSSRVDELIDRGYIFGLVLIQMKPDT